MVQGDSVTPSRPEAWVEVPSPTEQAILYHRSGNALWAIGAVFAVLIPALILFSGLSARLRSLAYRLGGRRAPSVMIYALLFTLTMSLLTLPLTFYDGYVRQHAYGLSNQSLGMWLGDWAKGTAVMSVGLALVLWIPYLLLRRSPRRWWLYAGLAAAPITALLLVISPLWIDPLFNDYGPLRDKALEARILVLAEEAGIPGSRVYQVDKSADTETVNAYVTGLGGSKRIVLWDTLLEKLEPDQIVFVAAHEMGHYLLHHVLTSILVLTLLALISLYAVHRLAGRLLVRYSRRFGFDLLSDVASFPLLLLLGGVVSFLVTPVVLALSRHQERAADRFALELTGNPRAAATTFVRLQEENLSVPRPGRLYMLWRGSHPSLAERIEMANRFQPP